jgi:phage tail sheath gpL-like
MISFNNIPNTTRTPNVYAEIDNSRALQGLVANPHKVLILGQKMDTGTAARDTVLAINKSGLADGYFGVGSVLARMCNQFKSANPNTEVYALPLSTAAGGVPASATINFSAALDGAMASGTGYYYLLVNGVKCTVEITSGMSGLAIAHAAIDVMSALTQQTGCNVSHTLGTLAISCCESGSHGNYIPIMHNYYTGESFPKTFSRAVNPSVVTIVSMADGTGDPSLAGAWAIIDGVQYHHIVNPYDLVANVASLESELADRFKPLVDAQGIGYMCYRNTTANLTTLGNARNSPHVCAMGIYNAPQHPAEWAAVIAAVCSQYLNNDPARPIQFLPLKNILPPLESDRFSRSERDVLLYDGISTSITDSGGVVQIERMITTYQKNALGIADPSYLNIETLATLMEIRYQYRARMASRFIIPRFKLADDSFPVQPGSYVVTPKTVKQEIVALFSQLQDRGLIENLKDFVTNLVIERDSSDRDRVNVLLAPDLVNQFRLLAGLIQFIL